MKLKSLLFVVAAGVWSLAGSAWGEAPETAGLQRQIDAKPAAGGGEAVNLTGPWQVKVGADAFDIAPAALVEVKGEKKARLPLPGGSRWTAGQRLSALIAYECSVKGALLPASVVVRKADGTVLKEGEDYVLEHDWAALARTAQGRIGADETVRVDYVYRPQRLDRLVRTAAGAHALRIGTPRASNPSLPKLEPGDEPLATIWLDGTTTRLAPRNLYRVVSDGKKTVPGSDVAERLLPKTLAKLRKGEPVTVLAWGDSVTDAGYLKDVGRDRWQEQFVRRLRVRFPKSDIKLITNGWGGRNTDTFLNTSAAPSGHPHNYVETVLDAKADLVVMEFVNDAGLTRYEDLKSRYDRIRADLTARGAEVCVLTPHYVRGDWMGLADPTASKDDPRPYVVHVRRWCAETQTAMADAAKLWGELAGRGIPYQTLLVNEINHPNPFGMSLFADALMGLFPPAHPRQ